MITNTSAHLTGNPVLDFFVTVPLILGFWNFIAQLLPAILGIGSGLLGGDSNATEDGLPVALDPIFNKYQQGFGDYLFNRMYTDEGGKVDMYGQQAFPGANGEKGLGTHDGPGTDTIGPLSPDINSTILPNVYGNWQPWDAGTQYIADFLYNKNPLGTEDPRTKQIMEQGGFGGPGNSAMASAVQYGTPSQVGQYLGNMAQFGVTGTPMGNFMKEAMSGGLNPYRKAPVPRRG